MATLADLRAPFETAREEFRQILADRFPGADEWTWHRACAHIEGRGGRFNVDTSGDAALAANADIRAAWDEYIKRLHVFYRARDGEHGVLGRTRAA